MQTEGNTYQFVLGWILLITILVFINKSRLGHVLIYYSLLLLILFIILVEYKQLAPIIASVQTVGQFDSSSGAISAPTTKTEKAGNL